MEKQIVYIPTKVEDEIPEKEGYYKTKEEDTLYFNGSNWFNNYRLQKPRYPIYWFKPTEGYFFTKEELKQFLQDYTDRIVENVRTVRDFRNPFLSPRTVVSKESIISQLEPFLKERL